MKPPIGPIGAFSRYVVWPTAVLLVLAAPMSLLGWKVSMWVIGLASAWFIVWGILWAAVNATGRRRD